MGHALKAGAGQLGQGDPLETAEYIADLVDELSKVARSTNLSLLAYLLDIAALEARTASGRKTRRRLGRKPLLLLDGHDPEG